jgi:hypothetical protein
MGVRRGLRIRPDVVLSRVSVIAALLVLLIVAATAIALWSRRPQLSEEQVRDAIYSTIQREVPAAFLVTGWIDVTAVTRVENTRTVLPGIVGLDLGTTSANVRVPGRVSYGFDVRSLRPEMIRLLADGVVEVDVPEPTIYSVEPDLSQMEIETRRGWARLSSATTERARDRAIELVQATMTGQGQRHLASSSQPRINTADALYDMLRPVLVAAGMTDPQIRFRIGRITIEPGRTQ